MRLRAVPAATNMDSLYQVLSWPRLSRPEAEKSPGVPGDDCVGAGGGVWFPHQGRDTDDVVAQLPSVGSVSDECGCQRPAAFVAYRVNGQDIEGFASSFLFTVGSWELLFHKPGPSNAPNVPKCSRFLLFIGLICVRLVSFMARPFVTMNLPGCLSEGFACLLGRNQWLWICS